MPHTTIALVSACLWDLRTQCEQQLRALTDAQRIIEAYRERPESRAVLKRQLAAEMETVLRTHRIVGEAAHDCGTAVHDLPAAGEEPSES